MKKRLRRMYYREIGLGVVCLMAVCLSAYNIFSIYQLRQAASTTYDHPYTVSNETRAMRSRLMDTKSFLLSLVSQPAFDLESVESILDERYAMQYESIEIISREYTGAKEDVQALDQAMRDLAAVQSASLSVILPLDQAQTAQYVEEHIYPKYDLVNEALDKVFSHADNRIKSLEDHASSAATRAIASAVLLTVFLPAYFLFTFWQERKSFQEIRYRERLFDVLSTNVNEVFLIFNEEKNQLEYVSGNCGRVLSIDAEALRRNTSLLEERVVPQDRDAFAAFVRRTGIAGEKNGEARLYLKSDEPRWVRLQSFPQMEGDKVARYIVSMTDRTEEMRSEQALRDALVSAQSANAAKQNFLSRMSHEIRTPMNAIIGMTTIAAAYIEDRKRVEDCLEKIGYSSKHLMSLINDVLDMSKIDEGKMVIAHEKFNLESVAESITSIIYPQAEEKGLTFTMPLVDLCDTVLIGDPMRLNQVLLNLLSNALKFTPRGGSIRLEIRQIQKKDGRARLRFTVSDTGIGMSEEFLSRIFLPFEQESAATGQKFGGTGLGMSICKNMVTLMGGTITVKSAPDKGSEFAVELDFDIAEADGEASSRKSQALEALKVLVADDDRDCCIHTSLLLGNLGILSKWVLTGGACVEEVLSAHKVGEDYDVCLIDLKMPDIDGVEVTRRVREFVGPNTTIIIITAYDWSAIEQSARAAGANAFLSKPIFASSLYNTLLAVTGIERAVLPSSAETFHANLAGRRALLAEDNDLNREIAVELLGMTGMEVDCAYNGKEALDRFQANGDAYDLILMDVQMPVMDGYQATEAIRRCGHPRARTIPIIAMTADAFHEDVVKARAAGMNGHLPKPIDMERLFQTIEDALSAADSSHST